MAAYGSIPHITQAENDTNADETTPLTNGSVKAPREKSTATATSLYARLVFAWFTPMLRRGHDQNKLDQKDIDLIPLPDDCHTESVMSKFDHYWQLERQKSNPNLFLALLYAFGKEFMLAGGLKLVHDLCVFVGPQVLHAMIVFLRQSNPHWGRGVLLTLAVTVSQLTMSLCLRHYFFQCYTVGLRIRTAVVVAVYRKALVLSSSERQVRSLGEITNLTSIDAQRLQDLTSYLHAIWYSPLQIALALFFLWRQLGASSLGGVLVICVMIPVTKQIAQWMGRMQKQVMRAKDQRVELNGEIMAGMKVIKFQAWEEPYERRITNLRNVELNALMRYFVGSCFSRILWTFTPLCVSIFTFGAYVWTGHDLDVATALTALALFDILRFPLFMLPQIINNVVEAMVSLNRVQSFLLCDEHEPVGLGDLTENGVRLENLSAAYDSKKPRPDGMDNNSQLKDLTDKQWEVMLLKSQLEDAEQRISELSVNKGVLNLFGSSNAKPQDMSMMMQSHNLLCLRRIDFELKPGELVAVVGGVGSGKSSFLNAIVGEVRNVWGTAAVKGKLAFYSQSPFIFNATVRDNILFGHVGEQVDEDMYQLALDDCALHEDLKILSDGDQTEIGEKGVTLSGGQKARVALARAVYHCAEITLIDDALAAVDAHVAKHLFEQAIVGALMRSRPDCPPRSIVLVTNAIQHLKHPRVDRIVVLQEGQVIEQGTYRELSRQKGSAFARYLSVLDKSDVSSKFGTQDGIELRKGLIAMKEPSEKFASDQIKKPSRLMTEELRAQGHIGLQEYMSWAKAAGGLVAPATIFLAFSATEGLSVMSNWWLTYWSQHGQSHSQVWFLGVYSGINVAAAIAGLARMLITVLFGLKASRQLFADLLSAVLHAPMSFFDTTPVGRIINRFSKDIQTVDEKLMDTLRSYLATLFAIFSTFAVITGVSPIFSLCLIPMVAFYVAQQNFFTVTYRELKRLDSVNRSPIYALLGESVDGVAVIRAFSAEDSLHKRLRVMLDIQQHAYYLTCAAQSWLAVRLELVGTLVITFACLSAVTERTLGGANESFAGLAGLAISYALSVTQSLNWSVRMASDMEANMVAVERVNEYSRLENEGARETEVDNTIPEWPTAGEIRFENSKLRYRDGLPLVLKGLNFAIPGGSKVGVVGRTGAGKSTLMIALMRIIELAEGKILIDNVDSRKVGLAKLRSSIAVIPQDPILFSGTIRSNLDPFDEYIDDTLYQILDRVGLYADPQLGSSNHSTGSRKCIQILSDVVAEGGINFSVGERQLLVIARALLRGAKIVIMDEATAAVDAETDAAIQNVMRTEFATATCITVAHRINSILDSNLILVMSNGQAQEFDTPAALLKRGGLFRDLVEAASSIN